MNMLLAVLLFWSYCPEGEVPFTYRAEYAHIYQIGTAPGTDQDGNPITMPVYNPWQRIFVQESPEAQAIIPCDPRSGEVCVYIVTSIDEYGMEDLGEDCGP